MDSRDPETVSSCVIGSGSRDVESESRDSQEVGLGSGTGSSDGEEDSATMNSEGECDTGEWTLRTKDMWGIFWVLL